MVAINAYRMDGLGNDFIIIDRRKNYIELTKDKITTIYNGFKFNFKKEKNLNNKTINFINISRIKSLNLEIGLILALTK